MTKSTVKRAPSSPLRAALAAKTVYRTYFDMSVVDTEVAEKAKRDLAAFEQMRMTLMLSGGDDANNAVFLERAQEQVDQAQAAVDACYHRIWFRGLGYTEFDALVALHPPTAEQAKDKWAWNPDTFNFALIAACAVDSDLTAEDWAAELDDAERWSRADRSTMINRALECNRQTMADAVPKD